MKALLHTCSIASSKEEFMLLVNIVAVIVFQLLITPRILGIIAAKFISHYPSCRAEAILRCYNGIDSVDAVAVPTDNTGLHHFRSKSKQMQFSNLYPDPWIA